MSSPFLHLQNTKDRRSFWSRIETPIQDEDGKTTFSYPFLRSSNIKDLLFTRELIKKKPWEAMHGQLESWTQFTFKDLAGIADSNGDPMFKNLPIKSVLQRFKKFITVAARWKSENRKITTHNGHGDNYEAAVEIENNIVLIHDLYQEFCSQSPPGDINATMTVVTNGSKERHAGDCQLRTKTNHNQLGHHCWDDDFDDDLDFDDESPSHVSEKLSCKEKEDKHQSYSMTDEVNQSLNGPEPKTDRSHAELERRHSGLDDSEPKTDRPHGKLDRRHSGIERRMSLRMAQLDLESKRFDFHKQQSNVIYSMNSNMMDFVRKHQTIVVTAIDKAMEQRNKTSNCVDPAQQLEWLTQKTNITNSSCMHAMDFMTKQGNVMAEMVMPAMSYQHSDDNNHDELDWQREHMSQTTSILTSMMSNMMDFMNKQTEIMTAMMMSTSSDEKSEKETSNTT